MPGSKILAQRITAGMLLSLLLLALLVPAGWQPGIGELPTSENTADLSMSPRVAASFQADSREYSHMGNARQVTLSGRLSAWDRPHVQQAALMPVLLLLASIVFMRFFLIPVFNSKYKRNLAWQ